MGGISDQEVRRLFGNAFADRLFNHERIEAEKKHRVRAFVALGKQLSQSIPTPPSMDSVYELAARTELTEFLNN
jgi:hypothetical protein